MADVSRQFLIDGRLSGAIRRGNATVARSGGSDETRRTARGARHQILRSTTFRLGLVYMGLFGISAAILLSFIYWSTAGYMARQTDTTIEAEITGLAERYRLAGLEGLVRAIEERLSRKPNGSAIYLLTDRRFTPLTGNLDRWPDAAPDADGWLDFELGRAGGNSKSTHRARARPFSLRGGFHLLVGRDMHELEETRALIARALAWGLGITALLALAGGAAMSRSTLRRVEGINETCRRIMAGDLSRRVSTRGTGDDFDQLAENLNEMLDCIERLMEDVRRVSDSIAHDLRSPLTRLRNRLESLKTHPQASPAAIEEALGDADGLLGTFNALLRIANVESGRRRAAFCEIALDAVLRDVVELYEPVAEERGQSLHLEAMTDARVRGDRDLLFQAVANLLDNAMKYTPRGGDIRISLHEDSDAMRLVVADSGPGIPPEARSAVLKRFFRLEHGRNSPGNGLGLSLVAAVARLHDATLDLAEAEPGLRVTITFPEIPRNP